jgi:hypothetical protein
MGTSQMRFQELASVTEKKEYAQKEQQWLFPLFTDIASADALYSYFWS